jgi:hypothetical protein
MEKPSVTSRATAVQAGQARRAELVSSSPQARSVSHVIRWFGRWHRHSELRNPALPRLGRPRHAAGRPRQFEMSVRPACRGRPAWQSGARSALCHIQSLDCWVQRAHDVGRRRFRMADRPYLAPGDAASRKMRHGKRMHERVRYLIHDELSMKNVNCHVLLWSRRLPMHGYQAVTI